MLNDNKGQPLAEIPFGGIYLPLERAPEECHRRPLLLAYHDGHFSGLTSIDGDGGLAGENYLQNFIIK